MSISFSLENYITNLMSYFRIKNSKYHHFSYSRSNVVRMNDVEKMNKETTESLKLLSAVMYVLHTQYLFKCDLIRKSQSA